MAETNGKPVIIPEQKAEREPYRPTASTTRMYTHAVTAR